IEEGGTAPNAGFNTSENTICEGESINFNDISSNSPTSWSWTFEGGSPSTSSSQNPQNINYTSEGTYGVTLVVSNEFGSDEYNMNVNVSSSPDISISSTAPLCSGQNTGTAVASATGSGLSYSWNNGQSGSNLIGVSAGNYTVTVSNSSGCSAQESVQISSTDDINIALTANNPQCASQANGSIDAEVSGGQAPYTFSWNNGGENQNLNNVGAGSYTLTVNDLNGCTSQSSVNVISPSELDLGLEVLDISCGNTTGSASINPTGGTAPYTIVWSTGSSQYGIEDLSAGNYSISVFDANSCSTSQNFSISEGNSLNLIESINHISCEGNNDGAISVNVLGGSGDYDISWSNGQSDNNISNLAAGDYTINVIDSEGCSGEETYTIEENEDLQISVFKTDISCHGMNDGSAQATISGGVSPYIIEWSNGDETAQSVGLSQGEYEIQVSDQNGCSSSETVTIVEPSELTLSTVVLNNETCEGSDGSAAVNIMGGTADYQILWSNGSVDNNAQNLGAGQYSVTVSDASGCQAFSGIEIIYDCEIQVPQSMLANGSCGGIGFMLDDFVHCVPVENASMYQWKFENIPAGLFFEAYTMGNNPSLPLEEVMNLNYGMDADVSVRAQVNNTWGSYGNVCSIGMNSQIPSSSLSKSDCGATDLLIGTTLECVPVSGAYAYEWYFHGPGVDTIAMSYINSIHLIEQHNFSAGQTYQVTVRAQVGEQFGQWGIPCSIHFDGESSINDLAQNNPTANIYPNPSNGENISIEMWNLFEKVDVIDIDVYDTSGKLIESIKLSPYGRTHFKE
ncbi:MAG: PKD domain-containing protein, partial [Flavobacteriales bacterium]